MSKRTPLHRPIARREALGQIELGPAERLHADREDDALAGIRGMGQQPIEVPVAELLEVAPGRR
ncbi:MAG: hypothetical protein E6I07_03525 [Chloroflexi bacterium]|nr:MAG: hypothetical protein E6I07_03525 [Chloroflexota bacterium]